nr:nitronate monooxygenase [Pseudonocardia sp. C8]
MGTTVPIVLAPMGGVAGGALAAAVSEAGGLGMIGVGYADADRFAAELRVARGTRVGCGFITWCLEREPRQLDLALDHDVAAVMLSFGDVERFAGRIRAAGVPLICQVPGRDEAGRALDQGAQVLVAQGGEGGGHGTRLRSTLTLVPEICDLVRERGDPVPVLAAGGVADGRGLAAVLALGAAGAVVGTRFAATAEATVSAAALERMIRARGDDTLATRVYDDVRGVNWPDGYTSRVLRSPFTDTWDKAGTGRVPVECLVEATARYRDGVRCDDPDTIVVTAGEAVGLIHRPESAATVVQVMAAEARAVIDTLHGAPV